MTGRGPLLSADRVRLYLTLVPYLLERGQVGIEEAARDFEVSPKQMRSMVEKLTLIGLPGDAGFWQPPQEQFDINWDLLDEHDVIELTNDVALRRVPRFTTREAAALVAGLQLVASVPSVAESGLVAGLRQKLARGASSTPPELVVAPSALDGVRDVVSRGIESGLAISFTYQAPDAPPTVRTVDPLKVLFTNSEWYLQGWCHLRQAVRTFHLDRVTDPVLTDIAITHRSAPVPELFAADAGGAEVVFRLPARLAPLIGDLIAHAEVFDDAETVTVRLRLADPRVLKRLAGRFGGQLEIVRPESARAAARDWAAAGLALYPAADAGSSG